MRKLLTAIFAALLVVVAGLPAHAQAARVNMLVKGSGATIYWAADNGQKYSFPNIQTFYTWFTSNDLRNVKKLTDKELKSIPTGGNVTYRGGAKLVKFPNQSDVYAVSRYSVLRPIVTGDVATQIYGNNWSSWVETVPWNLRGDYTIGATIRSASDYSASNEYNGVKTPTDNLLVNYAVNTTNPTYSNNAPTAGAFNGSLTLSTSRLYNPERAQLSVALTGSNRAANQVTIQIKNQSTNTILQTCYASYTCSFTWNIDTVATQDIVALASDASGYSLGSNHLSIQGLSTSYYSGYNSNYPYYYNNYYGTTYPYNGYSYYNYNNSYNYTFTADRNLKAEWTADRTLRLTASITSYNRSMGSLRMAIIDTTTNQTVKNCEGVDSCQIDIRTDSNYVNSTRYALQVSEVNGQQLGYVYANAVGSNTYGSDYQYYNYDYYYGYSYNCNYAPYNKVGPGCGYYSGYYGTPTITTYAARTNSAWNSLTTNITATVTGMTSLSNTRIEIYANPLTTGGSARLVQTCYNTSSCSAQDAPYYSNNGVSYFSEFFDVNGYGTYSSVVNI